MKKYHLGVWEITVALPHELSATPLCPVQVHGAVIVPAAELVSSPKKADGVVIQADDPPTAIQTADCLPLVLMTPDTALALHVSRKSLITGLLDNVPRHINPKEIEYVFFGPHICAKHFTFEYIGEEVQRFIDQFPSAATSDKPAGLSLVKAIEHYLQKWGIEDVATTRDGRCTYEDSTLASRRHGYDRGGTVIDRFYTIVTHRA